ncbi:MAG TPA: ricin-type beta-trefoil lectin domain protein [Trebonia sp.]|nr:ricin-type beta-trefoil lectin domain protein [Trebonia sp.]
MRNIKRIAAAAASTGLLALGGLTAGSGPAEAAAPSQVVTSCSYGTGTTVIGGVTPNCTSTGMVANPTDLEINLDPNGVLNPIWGTIILPILGGIKVSYNGTCAVNGQNQAFSGSYEATSNTAPGTTTLNLQQLVGSPVPGSCEVTFSVTTIAAIPTILGLITPFTATASVQSVTSVPGAIWQASGTTSKNATASTCADDTGNGNAGSLIQAFTCLSDLADFYTQTATGQLVHNGDCVTDSGNDVSLQTCTAGDTSQYWTAGTSASELVNKAAVSGSGCLTAPSPANGTKLTVAACTGAANQLWTAPAQTPGSGS